MDEHPDREGNAGPPASPVPLARMAGLLYLVVAIFGGVAMIVRVNVYEPEDAAALRRGNRRTPGTLATRTAAVAPTAVIANSEGRMPTVELTRPTTRLPTGINPAVVR